MFSQDADGDTALHLSARHGYHKIAELLLSAGAECGPSCAEETPPVNLQGRTARQECPARDTGMVQLFNKYAALSSAYLKLGETGIIPRTPVLVRAKPPSPISTHKKNAIPNEIITVMPSAPPMEFQTKKRMAPVIVN